MKRWNSLTVASTAVVLGIASLVAAHGDETGQHGAGMGAETGTSMSNMTVSNLTTQDAGLPTYFRHPEHVKAILAHIVLMVAAWVFVLPVAVALSVARSRYQLLAQATFLFVNAVGIATGAVYNNATPDFYAGNKHHPIGWVSTWVATIWVILGVLSKLGRTVRHKRKSSGQPITQAAMAMFRRFHDSPTQSEHRWSGDSGQGTERNTASLCAESRTNSFGSGRQQPESHRDSHDLTVDDDEHDDETDDDDYEKHGFLRRATVDRFLPPSVGRFSGFTRTKQILSMAKVVLDKVMVLLAFIAILTGGIVYGGIMNGASVFNGLAHFIKGGIFFWYGFLCLGRWMGCFADFGWGWNRKPPKEIVGRWCAMMPSAEFFESATIAFYGISNVGLERLANTDGQWAAIDLEHISITLMFLGGGLATIQIKKDEYTSTATLDSGESFEEPEQWRFPMNPMPALIVTLLGVMMGSHHQASMVSTMMHAQWGNLFAGFGLARLATYAILYLRPPTSYLPQRPPTEIVASFCLMAGGILFMLSNKDTVAALEYNNLDAMFIFNVVMGFNAFIMAWGAICMALKGFAQRQEMQRSKLTHSAA